ncbi:MAG TPA: hypothetical protein VGM92_03430, partial [Candidatus Kapabacteria bacterium]
MKKESWEAYAGAKGFWGFGSPFEKTSLVFIGREFGGSDLKRRIEISGDHDFVDAQEYHSKLYDKNQKKDWIKQGSLRVPTYSRLIAAITGLDNNLRRC